MKRILLMSVVASLVLLCFSSTADACCRRGCATVACVTCDPCDTCDPCGATSVSYFPTRFYRTSYWGYRGFYRPFYTTGFRGRFISYRSGCCW